MPCDSLVAEQVLPQIAPMLLGDYAELWEHHQREALTDPEWIAQEKHDGVRAKLHVGAAGQGNRLDGRKVSRRTGRFSEFTRNLPHLADIRLPGFEGMVLDGELVTSATERSHWRAVSATLWANAPQLRLEFVVFDLVGPGTYRERYASLRRLWAAHGARLAAAGIHLAECRTDRAALYDDVVARGGEGVVLKRWDMPYAVGRRSNLCLKRKPTEL